MILRFCNFSINVSNKKFKENTLKKWGKLKASYFILEPYCMVQGNGLTKNYTRTGFNAALGFVLQGVWESVKVKVKKSLNRPGVAQRVPGGLGSQISMTFGT